ncbi:MAG: magnesium transporter [Proteobacteria bacterium]|nr:magnesium transporter [Pseudomonadota bacterium]
MAETVTSPHTISIDDLWEIWPTLDDEERVEWFEQLDHTDAEEFFSSIPCEDQAAMFAAMKEVPQKHWMRSLAPDDAADVLQLLEDEEICNKLKSYLQPRVRKEVDALMAYKEDEAGGLMSPRFARIRPDMSIDEAILYVRKQMRDELETIYQIYVLDNQQHLIGVVSFEDLFKANDSQKVSEIMETEPTTVDEDMDQESVALLFAREDTFALPVVDSENVMKGIITIDDIVDVVQEEATEDIQKMGGMAALDNDYLQSTFRELYTKRIGWLVILFCCTLVTTRVMDSYSEAMEHAIILGVFVPLIMASGGNTGSQAATLVTRAMALGEVRLRDVLRVLKRELIVSSGLGATLAILGAIVAVAYHFLGLLPEGDGVFLHFTATIALSVGFLVIYGSIVGSMLPFLLKFCHVDPASASAPFVTTILDASGIVIYFTIAKLLLSGILL